MFRKVALVTFVFSVAVSVANAQIVAMDDFENNNPGTAYNDGIQYNDNGGVAFGPLTYLEGSGGGLFDASLSGVRALGVYAGGGGTDAQALGRTLQTSFDRGVYSLDARFSLNNGNGFSGFNIKSGLGSTFGANELMSFGLNPPGSGGSNSQFFVTDGTGTHLVSVGTDTELRGSNFHFSVAFDTLAETYTLTVTDLGNAQMGSFSGTLKDTNGGAAGAGAVAAIGFANFDSGNGHDLIADNLAVVPEPSTWLAAAMAVASLVWLRFGRSRRQAVARRVK